MKIFTVYHNPNAKKPEDSTASVAEDFSLWGFIFPFNVFWGLKRKCWLFAFLSFTLFIIYLVSFFSPFMLSPYINVTKIPAQLFLGVFANDFYRFSLKNQGFEFIGLVSAKNEEEATYKWLEQNS